MKQTLIILGIVLLGIALAVVYFERKLREQNHKIASMFSLVSSLAEELNAMKYKESLEPETIHIGNQLIDVSDDELELIEEEEEEEEEDYEEEEEESLASNDESEESSVVELEELDLDTEEEPKKQIKILKLDIDDEEEKKTDFKKMTVGELRTLAISKGIDAAKLKKGELVELLSK
jgi:hypothetical protein